MMHPMMVRMAALVLVMLLVVPSSAVRGTERGALLSAEGSTTATLDGVRIAAALQGEDVTLAGAGFDPGEPVGIWGTFPNAAVAAVDAGDLRADTEGDFTVELRLDSTLPIGLHRFSARGRASGRGAIASLYLLPGGAPVSLRAGLTLTPGIVRQQETARLTGQGFAAQEPVALWLTLPDGSVISLGRLTTTGGGFDTDLLMPEWLPIGRYMVTARGVTGGATAIAELTLRHGNGLDVAGAELAANIGRAKQRTRVEVKAGGLQGNEPVSFWLTLPDGAVFGLGDARADAQGNLDVDFYMSEALPAGQYYLSLHGNRSGLGSFARLMLEPGPKSPGEE